MAINHDDLAAEVADRKYAGLQPWEIATAINADQDVVQPISADEVLKLWSRWMVLAACDETLFDLRAKGDPGMLPARILLRSTIQNLQNRVFPSFDPRDPTQQTDINKYLDGLVAVGVLTADQKTETLALATTTRPGWQAFGHRDLDYADIIKAQGVELTDAIAASASRALAAQTAP